MASESVEALESIQKTLHAHVLEHFPAARTRGLAVGDSLLDTGIIDSMGILELVTFIEEHYAIALSDEDMVADHFASIPSLAALVQARLAGE